MMKKFYLGLGLLCCASTAWASYYGQTPGEVLTPESVEGGECTNHYAPADDYVFPGFGDLQVEFSYSNGVLTATAINVVANCCPEELTPRLSRDGNDLYFTIYEVDGRCDCICPYTLSGSYGGIEPGEYTLHFRDWDEQSDWPVVIEEGLDLRFNITTSVRDVEAPEVAINVNADSVVATGEGAVTLEVVDASGTVKATAFGRGSVEISTAHLPSGWYVARASLDGRPSTRPFMK